MAEPIAISEELNHRARLGEARLALDMALEAGERPFVSTKFGADSAVFLHLVTRRAPDVPVVWVESGYESRATRRFADELVGTLSLNLHVFRPEAHAVRPPPALGDPDHAAFTEEVKLAPFRRAIATLGADVWLSSIRRYQSAHRAATTTFDQLGPALLKVSPMLGWTSDDVARYAREHALPHGPDAFDPTKGEPFRECGLHTDLGQVAAR